MADYRLYFMTADGHVGHRIDFVCEDDEQAVEVVRKRRESGPLELWQSARQVKVFPKAGEP